QRVVMGPDLGHNLVPEVGDSTPFRMCGTDHTVQCMFSTGTAWRSRRMRERELKEDLHRQLRGARAAVLWKLDGLSEYDVRRPLVPTGTNLLGLVKHVGSVVAGYFGECFGRPFPEPMPWLDDDAETNADMWATADESREQIVGFYNRAWDHAFATIKALDLDTVGNVSWWPPPRNEPPLRLVLVHMIAETERHAG